MSDALPSLLAASGLPTEAEQLDYDALEQAAVAELELVVAEWMLTGLDAYNAADSFADGQLAMRQKVDGVIDGFMDVYTQGALSAFLQGPEVLDAEEWGRRQLQATERYEAKLKVELSLIEAGMWKRIQKDQINQALTASVEASLVVGGNSRRVAQTGVTEAFNQGQTDSLNSRDSSEWPITKTWVTMGDHRVRPTHVEADGQTVPYGSMFIVGGWPIKFPGEGPPSEAVNCRCHLEYLWGDEVEGIPTREESIQTVIEARDQTNLDSRLIDDFSIHNGEWNAAARAGDISSDLARIMRAAETTRLGAPVTVYRGTNEKVAGELLDQMGSVVSPGPGAPFASAWDDYAALYGDDKNGSSWVLEFVTDKGLAMPVTTNDEMAVVLSGDQRFRVTGTRTETKKVPYSSRTLDVTVVELRP